MPNPRLHSAPCATRASLPLASLTLLAALSFTDGARAQCTPPHIVFVVDGSGSVTAPDFANQTGYVANLIGLLNDVVPPTMPPTAGERYPGMTFGIVQFGAGAAVELDFTADPMAASTAASGLVQRGAAGTAGEGLSAAYQMFDDAMVTEGRVVILLADGDNCTRMPLNCSADICPICTPFAAAAGTHSMMIAVGSSFTGASYDCCLGDPLEDRIDVASFAAFDLDAVSATIWTNLGDACDMMAPDGGVDAGPMVDAGTDGGLAMDAGADAGPAMDAGTDAGSSVDAGSISDASMPTPDAGPTPDIDAGAEPPPPASSGCQCRVSADARPSNGGLVIGLAILLLFIRRRSLANA